MNKVYSNSLKSIVLLALVTMLFSCTNRINQVREMTELSFTPQLEESGMNVVFTDSGKIAAQLLSPKMLEYAGVQFPYREFPEGIELYFYDKDGEKNTVLADYAIQFENSKLIDLQGNVKVFLSDSTLLTARQLYWDQEREWVFTDKAYTLKMNNGTINNGQGFDANQDFNNFNSRTNTGVHPVENKNHE